MSIRRLTVSGEKAMERAELTARAMLDETESGIERSYVAIGLLGAVLPELTSGIAQEVATETLRDLLSEIEGKHH